MNVNEGFYSLKLLVGQNKQLENFTLGSGLFSQFLAFYRVNK